MHRDIKIEISDTEKFARDLRSNKPFIEVPTKSIRQEGFKTKPYSDLELNKDFPNCCNYHSSINKQLEEWFVEFPNCCEIHKELVKHEWFKKEDYLDIPQKIIIQLEYVANFITVNIKNDNWFELISDYIEYTIESYGTPSVGSGKLVIYLKNWIKNNYISKEDFPNWKRNQILEFLESYENPSERPKTDMNVLYSTVQRWIKTFPNLEYFKAIKKDLSGRFPLQIILYEPKTNRYTGETKFKVRSKAELVEILINSTKNFLSAVNTPHYLKNKIIPEKIKYELEILGEQHKLKQNSLLVEYSNQETKYLKIIKKWLKNEKSYIKSLTAIIQKINSMPKKYSFERRKTFETEYLKVFIRDKDQLKAISELITSLQSVRKANVSDNKEPDLTVYPSRTYSIEEMESEIEVALDSYFEGGEYDPIFEDKISKLSDKGYQNINNRIYNYGRNLEKYKGLYDKFDEEGFRDFFLPHLNSISKNHTATGETFNKIGKTDILIQDAEGLNVFIGECKIWKGQNELKKAVDQLLDRYVTWRDEKAALIVFNKDMKDFTELIKRAKEAIEDHPLFSEFIESREESSLSFKFHHPDDKSRFIDIELIIFNCT